MSHDLLKIQGLSLVDILFVKKNILKGRWLTVPYSGPSQAGGPGGHVPPHFLADQLTLSQPGGAHYLHPVLCAPPDFQNLRRPWTCILPFIWRCMWKRIWCLRRPLCRRKIRWDFWVWFWSEIIFIVIAARNRYLRIGCRVGRGGPIGLITKISSRCQTEAIMCWNK